jgi:hypothetical protein
MGYAAVTFDDNVLTDATGNKPTSVVCEISAGRQQAHWGCHGDPHSKSADSSLLDQIRVETFRN